jgi:group I intron endonuclease
MIVYVITNTKNRKRYVGITTKSVAQRWYEHCWLAANGGEQALYRAMRKHGVDCFLIEQIDEASSLDELLAKERQYILSYGSHTKTGHGYNMTLGGDGVFGFEFSEKTKVVMAEAAAVRFGDPVERERQRQRQERFWTEIKRAEHSAKIIDAHERNPEQARRHAAFMKQHSDPEKMRARARQFWDTPGARERFKQQKADYWSDPTNREKASREIKRRFADNPQYARNVSEGKKRHHRENPGTARRRSEYMKKRVAQNPEILSEMSERALAKYREDPTLKKRQGESRRRFYAGNPEARVRAGEIARRRAKDRRKLRGELELLAETYRSQTGEIFPIPGRSEGSWQETVMLGLIDRLKILLSTGLSIPARRRGISDEEAGLYGRDVKLTDSQDNRRLARRSETST